MIQKEFLSSSHIIASLRKIRAKSSYGIQVVCYETRRRGLKGLLSTLFKIIRSKLLGRRLLIFTLTASDSQQLPISEVPNYKIVSINSTDMIDKTLREQLIQYQHYFFRNPEEMLRKGANLWIGYFDGQFAHIAFTRSGDKVGSFFFPLTSECILIEDCVTFPKYRGHRLYQTTLTHIVRTFRNKDFKRFYIYCSNWNTPSERAIRRAGFNLICQLQLNWKGQIVSWQESQLDLLNLIANGVPHESCIWYEKSRIS